MIEAMIKKIVNLDHQDGLNYAQWGIMRVITESDCPYSEWQQERNQKGFWLEKVRDNQRISPVYGIANKETV